MSSDPDSAGILPLVSLLPEAASQAASGGRAAPRLHFIDGLRGLAMLMVLVYHCWLFGGSWSLGLPLGNHSLNLVGLISLGHIGVNLFLVLSGFCLFWPFVKSGRRSEPTLWEFARKRCRRILPPYYATLLLCLVLALIPAWPHDYPTDTGFLIRWSLTHVFMLHNLMPAYATSINGSLWSLGLEFQLYILFPVLVEAYRRFQARGVILTVLVVCSAFRFFLVREGYVLDDTGGYTLAYSVFGRCFEFALGMFTALMVARWHDEQKNPLNRLDLLLPALVIPLAILEGRHGHYQALTDSMWGLVFAGLILAGSRPGAWVGRLLSSRGLVALGTFSYSVYLIHFPLVATLGHYGVAHFQNTGRVVLMLLVVAPSMLVLGYLFHLLFEKPFMNAPRIGYQIYLKHSGN